MIVTSLTLHAVFMYMLLLQMIQSLFHGVTMDNLIAVLTRLIFNALMTLWCAMEMKIV